MTRLQQLKKERAEIVSRMEAILALADSEGRNLTDEESKEWSDLEAKATALKASEEREEKLTALQQGHHKPKTVVTSEQDGPKNIRDAWQDDPACGYKSQREFLLQVMQVQKDPQAASPQLKFLAAAGTDEANTLSDPYGGFLVPEAFSPDVKTVPVEVDPTASRVMQMPMSSPTFKFNARVDKNHASSVSGGLTVSRTTETQAPSATRQQYEQIEMNATGLFGLAYASEQLLERSAVSFVALLDQGFRDEFASKMLQEKISGTGVGEPEGILVSPATISVDKESGQAADTINAKNITKMRSRAYNYGRCIWIANHDTYTQLVAAHTAFTASDAPIFTHGNGTDVPDTLLGRPIYFSEYAKTLGDNGDIILADWSQYIWGTLGSQSPRRAESVHVRFLNHERTFKFWVENDGKCWWRSALTPVESSTTLSPFVTLAARA